MAVAAGFVVEGEAVDGQAVAGLGNLGRAVVGFAVEAAERAMALQPFMILHPTMKHSNDKNDPLFLNHTVIDDMGAVGHSAILQAHVGDGSCPFGKRLQCGASAFDGQHIVETFAGRLPTVRISKNIGQSLPGAVGDEDLIGHARL